jgi:predicted tellurium resistance membrane protein TerC
MEYVIALIALTAMEIVLGIDNIVFIAIATSRLSPGQQPRARRIGLTLAMGTRILLLFALSAMLASPTPCFTFLPLGCLPDW